MWCNLYDTKIGPFILGPLNLDVNLDGILISQIETNLFTYILIFRCVNCNIVKSWGIYFNDIDNLPSFIRTREGCTIWGKPEIVKSDNCLCIDRDIILMTYLKTGEVWFSPFAYNRYARHQRNNCSKWGRIMLKLHLIVSFVLQVTMRERDWRTLNSCNYVRGLWRMLSQFLKINRTVKIHTYMAECVLKWDMRNKW